MAITNHERLGKALDLLKHGLGPCVEREFENTYRERAHAEALRIMGDDKLLAKQRPRDWDAAAQLKLMWDAWNDIFRRTLGPTERGLKNTSVGGMVEGGILESKRGQVRLHRLHTLCERKKRAAQALAYNGLVQSWPEITRLAREGDKPTAVQGALFGDTEERSDS